MLPSGVELLPLYCEMGSSVCPVVIANVKTWWVVLLRKSSVRVPLDGEKDSSLVSH